LQAFAGIVTVSVGHCHPEVVAAVNAQNQLLQHTTTIYLNNQIAEYAKELADRMPGNLKVSCCAPAAAAAAQCSAAACWGARWLPRVVAVARGQGDHRQGEVV
jgi:4-aminobutyrate aminotransferase-like enzyme